MARPTVDGRRCVVLTGRRGCCAVPARITLCDARRILGRRQLVIVPLGGELLDVEFIVHVRLLD